MKATNYISLNKPTLIIYGPTASGKTALAIRLAKKINGELISSDSRQIYKKLDIGTGKVSLEDKPKKENEFWEVDGVKIYGFDQIEPGKDFSAAKYLKYADKQIKRIKSENKIPIIVGGTGFYIKAQIEGIETIGIKSNKKLR
ncbi:hypothetical protein HY024_04960, partial [Candidatus Curtissbacteria bacterium]|nr:hypothetical protein [Candidatus Curtissbacteria bacterium]